MSSVMFGSKKYVIVIVGMKTEDLSYAIYIFNESVTKIMR